MATNPTKPFAVKGFNVTTPKGKALWCKIAEPDRKYTPTGELSMSLVCDPGDPTVVAFISKLEEVRDIALAETKKTLGAKGGAYTTKEVFSEEYDQEGEPTGKVIFKMKLKDIDGRKERGKQHSITVVDAKRQVVNPIPLVGNGSDVKCVVFANPYSMASTKSVGVSMIWDKMQIIELISFGGGDAGGFDEEDGFEAPSEPSGINSIADADDTDF